MTTQVHIWLPDSTHVGHAALTIENDYISFWPDGSAGKKDLKIKTSHPGTFMEELADDIRNEGGRAPITIDITGLNEREMLLHIKDIIKSPPRYQLARNNCSHIIANILKIGGGKDPNFIPHAGAYGVVGRVIGIGIWTPDQVLRFARYLATKA